MNLTYLKMIGILTACRYCETFKHFVDFDALENWICNAYHKLGYEAYCANVGTTIPRARYGSVRAGERSTVRKFQSKVLENDFYGEDRLEVCIKMLENLGRVN